MKMPTVSQPSAASVALTTLIMLMLMTVFSQSAQAQNYSVIYNFTGASDGRFPYGGVTMDTAGNLYGTTVFGGANDLGAVFKLTRRHSAWVPSLLYSFAGGNDGTQPEARVVFGPEDTFSLYSTTYYGGGCCGTIFKLQPTCSNSPCDQSAVWNYSVLYRFTGGDGGNPRFGDLAFDQAHPANIYGSTNFDGTYGLGTVYELSPSGGSWTEKVLYSFSGSDGAVAQHGVIFDHAGNLYGTTYAGGTAPSADGVVFQLVPSQPGWTENVLYSFDRNGAAGGILYAGLIMDHSGNLYGATTTGGPGGGGTVFELTSINGSWVLNVLYGFTGTYECGPNGNLVLDATGNLYGTTSCDGANGAGSVFKLTKSGDSWTYTSLHDFTNGSDGGFPNADLIMDVHGNLFGTGATGGANSKGVVFEVTP